MSAPGGSAKRRRALAIGRSPAVMSPVIEALRAMGHDVEGDTEPERAAERPDAASFDVVAIGRGVTGAARVRLREAFAALNPDVTLLDAMFQDAALKIAAALDGRPSIDLEAYLTRIGYAGPRAPTLEVLRAIVSAHLATIPFEALDALTGRGVDISAAAVDAKLIGARRGGYCYEQNGLLKRALAALGFEVDALLARICLGASPDRPPMARSHMTLRVMLDGAAHIADVGCGGYTPTAPLRMDDPEPQDAGFQRYRVTPLGPLSLLEMEGDGAWAPVYEIYGEPQLDVDFEPANWFTATHPSSFFRRELVAARTTAEARYSLYVDRLTIRRRGDETEQRTLGPDEAMEALREIFGLEMPPDLRDAVGDAAFKNQATGR